MPMITPMITTHAYQVRRKLLILIRIWVGAGRARPKLAKISAN